MRAPREFARIILLVLRSIPWPNFSAILMPESSAKSMELPISGPTGQSIVLPDRRALPIEFWIVAVFSSVFLVGVHLGLPINWPDSASFRFVQKHYFSPLLGAFGLQMALPFLMNRGASSDRWLMLKLLPFVMIVVLLHFNFKAWMPLVNPRSFDEAFHSLDQWLEPVKQTFVALRTWIAERVAINVDHAYHGLFVAMFFISLALHAGFDKPVRQRQLVMGLCLILLLGGVAYWIAPAVGPFLYGPGCNLASQGSQAYMWHQFQGVVQSGQLPPGYFTAPLAAMPSLHVAHALFLTMFAFGSMRWLFLLYLPALGWIVIESVASGWHYLIDLPFGAILAILCFSWARCIVPAGGAAGMQDRKAISAPAEEDSGPENDPV